MAQVPGRKMPHRITISLRDDQYLGLEEVAEDLGMNISDAAREAINAYLLGQHWKETIGKFAEGQIIAGKSNEEVLALVLAKYPHAQTTKDSIAWYRSQLRKKNPDVVTDREARARRGGPAG